MEADLVKREGISFKSIPAAGVHGVGVRSLPGNLLRLGRGFLISRQILKQQCPEVLLFTGGYVAVPMAMAARLPGLGFRRPRNVLYIPDIEPGLALKVLIRFSDQIAVTTEESQAYLPAGETFTVSGYPLRSDLQTWSIDEARQKLGIEDTELPILLVSGGSRGSRSINRALIANLKTLLSEMEIVHISGQLDWPEVQDAQSSLPSDLKRHYHPFPYLHEMGAAFSVADLVVSRAGASCLGEYPQFGLAAVLVPYPYAWRYQKVNADYLAQRGAAIVIENDDLHTQLLPLVRGLMSNPERRERMCRAMRCLRHANAAQTIASILYPQELGKI